MIEQNIDSNRHPHYYDDDEITLKELILKIREFALELWRNNLKIVLGALVLSGLFGLNTLRKEVKYTSAISFTLIGGNTKPTVAYSPYGDMEFGFVESNKIKELARSSRIMYEVLLKFVMVNDHSNFLANHIAEIYELNKKWNEEKGVESKLSLLNYSFSTSDQKTFVNRDFRAMNAIHELASGNTLKGKKGLISLNYDEKSDIFNLSVESINSDLSAVLSQKLFEKLSDFYTNETVGKPKEAFEKISADADSTLKVLNRAEQRLAYANDRNRGLTSSMNQMNISKLSSEVSRLNVVYNQLVESRQRLEFSLSQDQAEFQVIDRTFIPIEDKPSILKSILLGIVLGGFLMCIWVIGSKIVRDAMAA